MAAYLMCQSTSGLPLFIRRKGDIPLVPFPVVASLNGVYTFASSQGSRLDSSTTETATIVWKEYESSIVLCIAATDTNLSTDHLKLLLDKVFQAVVFTLGLDEIVSIKNVERLKKDLKCCFPIVDTLLDSLSPSDEWDNFHDITNCSDMLCCSERQTFEGILNCFTESVGTVFGCLLISGKIAAATRNWWTLSAEELSLIYLLLHVNTHSTGVDVPVYLPVRSPRTPFRLVRWRLTQVSEVCILCGPNPSLSDLEKEVRRFWRSAFAILRTAESVYPSNIPKEIVLEKSVLAFLVMNTERKTTLSSLNPRTGDDYSHLTVSRRKEILRVLYKTVMGPMLPLPGTTEPSCSEVFMNHEYYVCHAMISGIYYYFALYPSGLHNHYLRTVSQDVLRLLTCEKSCRW